MHKTTTARKEKNPARVSNQLAAKKAATLEPTKPMLGKVRRALLQEGVLQ